MTISSKIYSKYQLDNPENSNFNKDLIYWREKDDIKEALEDIFKALEVIPGITFKRIHIEKDESKFPKDLLSTDIERSRLDLAQIYFNINVQDIDTDITLNIFLPKLVNRFFHELNGNLYFPIFQLVDKGTYLTKKTFTLKTLLMPLMFRRDTTMDLYDAFSEEHTNELVYTLDLFKNKINIFKYFYANRGFWSTLEFFNIEYGTHISLHSIDDVEDVNSDMNHVFEIKGPAKLFISADRDWISRNPKYHMSLIATLIGSLDDKVKLDTIINDDIAQWQKRLGKYFTQNTNNYEEKANKIIISLERILDNRTRKNLEHVQDSDKENVYTILRWMMSEYYHLTTIDGMDVCNKRIRVAEYLIHPLLLKFSESTYRLLNSKTLTYKGVLGIFKQFMYNPDDPNSSRPQVNFLIKKLITNELLRYSNMVNSIDLITALRWTSRGPQSLSNGGKSDISLRYRGHHPSYLGRIGLVTASASDPGTSGSLVPFCKTNGQFFI
jgi:hypothetical protein